ncbi:hypothetical protein ACFYU9_05645 [Streptomyces sp. NPDC004327]|uniref:hypothetical protein n=1 Tax=Streptomyces sp. NPDC004327 TaxID=3364699 RepID=UPI00367DE0A1
MSTTRAAMRPELEAAAKLAREVRSSCVAVTLVVHEEFLSVKTRVTPASVRELSRASRDCLAAEACA